MSECVQGILYLVSTRARLRGGDAVLAQWIVVANDPIEIDARMRWALDVSKFESFAVTKVEKVRTKLHRLWMKVEGVNDEAPAFIEVPAENGTARVRYTRTNQPKDANTFAIGLGGKVSADSEEHAIRKVAAWLAKEGVGEQTKPPFHAGYQFMVEALGASDSTCVVDYDAIEGKSVRGGAVGMGRR